MFDARPDRDAAEWLDLGDVQDGTPSQGGGHIRNRLIWRHGPHPAELNVTRRLLTTHAPHIALFRGGRRGRQTTSLVRFPLLEDPVLSMGPRASPEPVTKLPRQQVCRSDMLVPGRDESVPENRGRNYVPRIWS